MSEEPKKYYFSPVPHQLRLFALYQFARTHPKDKIAVLCYGKQTVDFLARYFTELEILTCRITGAMAQSQRDSSLKQFKSVSNVLLISQEIAENVDFGHPTWLVEYAVPGPVPEFIKLVKNISAQKTILFVDPENEVNFVEKVKEGGLEFTEIKFDQKKLPEMKIRLLKLLDKIYDFYKTSQFAYREMINAYINSQNPEFDAQKLRLKDASASFGIEHPPKLPLTK